MATAGDGPAASGFYGGLFLVQLIVRQGEVNADGESAFLLKPDVDFDGVLVVAVNSCQPASDASLQSFCVLLAPFFAEGQTQGWRDQPRPDHAATHKKTRVVAVNIDASWM